MSQLQPPHTRPEDEFVAPQRPAPVDDAAWQPTVVAAPAAATARASSAQSEKTSTAPLLSSAAAATAADDSSGSPRVLLPRRERLLRRLPLFHMPPHFVLFPGEQQQLHIFEKRYQLLMQQCMQQGGCFGYPHKGLGVTAAVKRCGSRPDTQSRRLREHGALTCSYLYEPAAAAARWGSCVPKGSGLVGVEKMLVCTLHAHEL